LYIYLGTKARKFKYDENQLKFEKMFQNKMGMITYLIGVENKE
jgi:hypothetical protein